MIFIFFKPLYYYFLQNIKLWNRLTTGRSSSYDFYILRPNLKNLSRDLNLSRGSNMVGSTKLYSIFQDSSRRSIETSFCADLSRGSNSLNSDTVLRAQFQMRNYRPCWCIFETSYLSYRNEQYVLFSVCRCVN